MVSRWWFADLSDLFYLYRKNYLAIVSVRSIFGHNTNFKLFKFSEQLHFMILLSKLSGSNFLRLNILLKIRLLEKNCIKLRWS